MGRACESVSTAFAFLGVDEAGVAQLGKDMIEELFEIELVLAMSAT